MIAVLVNVGAVIFGSLIGLLVGKKIKSEYQSLVMVAAGAFTCFIGLKMAFKCQRELYAILSLVIGGALGTWIGIENWVLRLGERLKSRLPANSGGQDFAQGFLTSSLIFCVGAMAVIGSFNAGTVGDNKIIFIKSVLDGFMAIILAGRYGLGVCFSSLSILVYQGLLTLLARWIQPYVSPLMLTEISGVGGIMVAMIGINLLELKKIKTGDFLPALIVVCVFCLFDPVLKPFLI
jgi:uncharacterized membrane protein YqgA involved in biofilm formation